MKASERARRYREADEATPLRYWFGWEMAIVAGVSGVTYLSIGLLSASWEQWWALAAAVLVGLVIAFAVRSASR